MGAKPGREREGTAEEGQGRGKRPVERTKDLLVGTLCCVGSKGPSTAQARGSAPYSLDLPSPQPLRTNCNHCLRKCHPGCRSPFGPAQPSCKRPKGSLVNLDYSTNHEAKSYQEKNKSFPFQLSFNPLVTPGIAHQHLTPASATFETGRELSCWKAKVSK